MDFKYLVIVLGIALILDHLRKINRNTVDKSAFFEGVTSLDNDGYKIFLTKKYDIARNEALNKIICKDKLFDSIDEAFNYAISCEIDDGNFIKPKVVKVKKTQPLNPNANCPNCNALVLVSDLECWQCEASFASGSAWKPIPVGK